MKRRARDRWVPIRKRLPPFERNGWVLIWSINMDKPVLIESYIAHRTGKAILDKEEVSWDRFFSDWIEIEVPEKSKKRKREK